VDSVSLTDAQRAEIDYRISGMSKILPMSSRGSRSGRPVLRNRDLRGRLASTLVDFAAMANAKDEHHEALAFE
jgi:hypothetical protein